MKGKIIQIAPAEPSLKIVALSGTPISNSPANGYSLLKILAPEILPSESKFNNHFCVQQLVKGAGGRMVSKTVNYKNLRDLKRMVEAVSIRRLASETSGMPDDIMIDRPVILKGDQKALYEEILQLTIQEIKGEPPTTLRFPTVKLMRLRQVINSPEILGLSGNSAKWEECDILVDEILSNPDAKLVIWTEWKESVFGLARRYKSYGSMALTGDTSNDELKYMENSFDTNSTRIIVATPFKGGTGINWLARARTAIWIERVWSLVVFRQALKRLARRVKQDLTDTISKIKAEPSRQIFLHAHNTVDDFVAKTLTDNSNLSEAVITPDESLFRLHRDDVLKFLERHG